MVATRDDTVLNFEPDTLVGYASGGFLGPLGGRPFR